jgi:radical SAM protein with 4Fe4S-binding SPASM domain
VRTDVLHWTLDGEPFVNRQIGEICQVAMEFGFRNFIFSSNGYFCTEERLAELPRGAGDVHYQLCIDFCASEALFERHRGTPNSWAKVKANLERLLGDESQSHIGLQVTDISSFEVIASQTHPDGLAALRALLPAESERLSVSGRIFHNATGHVQGVRERKQASSGKYNLCPYPWTSMVIASNGDVVACCRDLQHKTVLGNLFEQDLAEIWHGERYQALRRALADARPEEMAACANCDLPFDAGKFTFSHLLRTGVQRLGIFR